MDYIDENQGNDYINFDELTPDQRARIIDSIYYEMRSRICGGLTGNVMIIDQTTHNRIMLRCPDPSQLPNFILATMDADTSVQAELFIPAELPEFTKQDDLSSTLDPPDFYKTTIHCGIQNGITRRDAIALLFTGGVLTYITFGCMNYLKNIGKLHTRKPTLSNDNSRMPRPTQTPSFPAKGESSKRRRDLLDVLWRGSGKR